jgi:hypothetical protein
MFEVEFVGLIKIPIYYVIEGEKTVLEAVLMGEACVLPLGFSDPGLEQYVRVCHGGRTLLQKEEDSVFFPGICCLNVD